MAIRYNDPDKPSKPSKQSAADLQKSDKSENAERSPYEKQQALSKMAADIEEVSAHPKGQGRKLAISIRLDPEIVEYFQGTGQKWQTRINDVLLDYVNGQKAEGD